MPNHWTERLYIENPDLFRASIEARFERTQDEIKGLIDIFNQNNVPKDGLILDLACGIGRISIPLAEKGYNVVGIDISPSYIQRASEYAKENGVSDNTRFILGDMRKVTSELSDITGFDAMVNMWTSMGYWDEETDLNILRQSLTLTNPEGIFVMHTANRDTLIRRFQARDFSFGDDGLVVLMERELDLESSRMINFWSYYRREGEDLRFLNRFEINHRVYSLHELKDQFQDAGWKVLESYGGFDHQPLSTDTFNMIIVAQR